MSINKFNSEGYYDPTAYEAMTTVEKEEKALRAFRPIVYICSPYAGDVSKNVENARNYSRFAVDKGYIPVAPHLLFPQFLAIYPPFRFCGMPGLSRTKTVRLKFSACCPPTGVLR